MGWVKKLLAGATIVSLMGLGGGVPPWRPLRPGPLPIRVGLYGRCNARS